MDAGERVRIGERITAWEHGRQAARAGERPRPPRWALGKSASAAWHGGYRHERRLMRAERRLPQLELPLAEPGLESLCSDQ